jgi:hypothetical protein
MCAITGSYRQKDNKRIQESGMLIHIIVVLVVVGILLWLINNYVPMDGKIKSILNAVVVIVVILWLLQAFGLLSGVGL